MQVELKSLESKGAYNLIYNKIMIDELIDTQTYPWSSGFPL